MPKAKVDKRIDPTPMDDRWRSALAAVWQKQSSWSRTAKRLKVAHRSWTGPLLGLAFLGVVLSTVSPQMIHWLGSPDSPDVWSGMQFALSIAGPVLVAVSAVLTRDLLGPKSEQSWIKARGVSEDLKAEAYVYAAGAPPYGDREAAPADLLARADALADKATNIGRLDDADPDIEKTYPHHPLSIDDYVAQRVSGQIDWHRAGARDNGDRLRRWRNRGIALAVVSAGFGVAAGARQAATLNVWVAVVSTAIATVTTFVYVNRFEFLAASYFATSQRLQDLINRWRVARDHGIEQGGRFVLDCEAVLAAQNRSWRDELSKRVSEELKAPLPTPRA